MSDDRKSLGKRKPDVIVQGKHAQIPWYSNIALLESSPLHMWT